MRSAFRKEYGLFVLLFVPGVLLGNPLLLLLSFFPVMYATLGRLYHAPRDIRITGEGRKLDLWSGDKIKVERRLEAADGAGLIVLSLPAPVHAKVISGPTVKVLWKGRERLSVPLDREIAVTRRGKYHLGSAELSVIPAMEGEERTAMRLGPDDHLLVQDRMLDIRKLRESRILNRMPMPTKTIGAIGSETTDFKEIRRYNQGDRYRSINWKATARAGEGSVPLVNQYEAEGRLSVLILLDNGPAMLSGNIDGTALEQGIHAVQALSRLYLASDCEVGFYAFDETFTVYPGAGRRQGALIARKLLDLEITDRKGSVAGAARAFPDHLRAGALVIVITTLGQENVDALVEGLGQLRKRMGSRTRIIVINIVGEMPKASRDIAAPSAMLDGLRTTTHLRKVRALGAQIDNWNPKELTFSQFMLQRFGGRG